MIFEKLVRDNYKLSRKIIQYGLKFTLVTNIIVGLFLLLTPIFPGVMFFYLIVAFNMAFILIPIVLIVGGFILYQKWLKKDFWSLVRNEVILILWTLASLGIYYAFAFIAIELLFGI